MCSIYKTIDFYNKASNSGNVINTTKKGHLGPFLYDIIYFFSRFSVRYFPGVIFSNFLKYRE